MRLRAGVLSIMVAVGAMAPGSAHAVGAHLTTAYATVVVGSPQGFAWCGWYLNGVHMASTDALCVRAAELAEEPGMFEVTVTKYCEPGVLPRADGCQSATVTFRTLTGGFQINPDTGEAQAEITYSAPDGPTTLHLDGTYIASARRSNIDSQPNAAQFAGDTGPPFLTVVVSAAGAVGTVTFDDGQVEHRSSITFGGVTYTGIVGDGDAWDDASFVVWNTPI